MTYYFKSCCDSSFTFTLTDYPSSLTLGDVWHVIVPNYFSGCSTVVDYLYPESPTYSFLSPGVTLQGSYDNCGVCTSAYTCNRITGTNECEIVTIFPMGISCVPNLTGNSISIIVSGGTPPYKIVWDTGTLGPTLVGPKPNEPYTVTVTDYNWPNGGPDYTATTTCSLIFPSPTPSPTPTPTPTPIPVVYPNLCLQFYDTKTAKLYTFTPTGNIVNGKPTWISGSLILQWSSGTTQPYWYIIIGGNILQNTNPSIPPIGSWVLTGRPGSGITYTGSCAQPRMTLISPTISPPNCVNTSTGSLIINPINAQPPVLYSINGGITTQNYPIFNNLPAGTYSIWVQDSNSVTQTQSAIVPNGLASTSYKLTINSTITPLTSTQSQLKFKVEVRNAVTNAIITTLPPQTTITFNLSEINNFMVANNPSYGERTYTVVVTKNGTPVGITPATSISTQTVTPTTTGCVAGTLEYSTATTLTYNGITITGSDVISGTVITTISKKSIYACYVKSQDNISIIQSNISGCNCCSIDGRVLGAPMNINITGGGAASVGFQIIKGNSAICQSPPGYQIVSPSNLQVFVPVGFTPITSSHLYSDSGLTQYVTPNNYFFAYNGVIYKVTNNGSPIYVANLYSSC